MLYVFWFPLDKSSLGSGDLEWYFFCPRERKYASGGRKKRTTESGYWKITGNDKKVESKDRTVGQRRTLIFHQGRAPRGERTNWVMHEYRLEDEDLANKGIAQVLTELLLLFGGVKSMLRLHIHVIFCVLICYYLFICFWFLLFLIVVL